ncbi:hypothetical protein DFH09DRAFT_1350288 [Mycena vulgaris]|nr:hypothetical protein DFH09DRAFT_1350288 [Mycena vulgaris]
MVLSRSEHLALTNSRHCTSLLPPTPAVHVVSLPPLLLFRALVPAPAPSSLAHRHRPAPTWIPPNAQTVHADKADLNEAMMRDLTSLHASMSEAPSTTLSTTTTAASATGKRGGVTTNSPQSIPAAYQSNHTLHRHVTSKRWRVELGAIPSADPHSVSPQRIPTAYPCGGSPQCIDARICYIEGSTTTTTSSPTPCRRPRVPHALQLSLLLPVRLAHPPHKPAPLLPSPPPSTSPSLPPRSRCSPSPSSTLPSSPRGTAGSDAAVPQMPQGVHPCNAPLATHPSTAFP